MLVAIEKNFEGAETHMRRRHAQQRGRALDLLAIHLHIAADDAQRARGRNSQTMHRLAAQIFADAGAQHRAPVAGTREWRFARAFQMQVPTLAAAIHHFAQQNRAAIAQLRHEMAKLMPGIQHGQGLGARQIFLSGKIIQKFGTLALQRIELD